MTSDHFQLGDIKNPFWREFMEDVAERFGLNGAQWIYYELFMRTNGEVPYMAMGPLRKMNNRAYLSGKQMLNLTPRQLRNIKRESDCST